MTMWRGRPRPRVFANRVRRVRSSRRDSAMNRVCVIGCGAIGSLYAAHLARVAEVWALVRRKEHARGAQS